MAKSGQDYDYQLIGKSVVQLLEALKLLPSHSEKTAPPPPVAEKSEEVEDLPSKEDVITYLIDFLKKRTGPVLLSHVGANISKDIKSAIIKNGYTVGSFLKKSPEIFAVPQARSGLETVELTKKAGGQADKIEEVERAPHSLKAVCKFFSTKEGCRWGDKCHRQHIAPEKKEA